MNSDKTDPTTTGYEMVQHTLKTNLVDDPKDGIETRKSYGIYISITKTGLLNEWIKGLDDEYEIIEVAVAVEGDVRTFTYEDFFERLGFDTSFLKDNAS